MTAPAPHEQIRWIRAQRGEDLARLAARTGLRVQHIRAIEEGRFDALPAGIYGRAAIRSLAVAYELDADALLASCEPLLPQIEDPISALARLRGIATSTGGRSADVVSPPPTGVVRTWRPFAAATVDGVVAGALLFVLSGSAALLAHVSIAALGSSAISLFLVGLVLEVVYYVWLGGLSGTTFGEYAVGPEPLPRDPRPPTVRAIALRTIAAATADVRTIYSFGMWAGRLTREGAARTDPPPAPSPSPPPPADRAEALTWSMSRRASVPPPPLHPRHG